MDTRTLAAQLAALMTYGTSRSVTVDGITWTIRQEHDSDSNLDDCDWWGKVEWDKPNRYSDHSRRPDGFNGNAEVVHTDGRSRLWWQPPADVKRTDDNFKGLRAKVRGWYRDEWSYCGIVVAMYTPCATCGGEKEVDASLWGIESDSGDDYFAETIADLISECEGQ